MQNFQSPDNGYFRQQVSPFRGNAPGYSQQQQLLEADLQTSDLPPHLQQTLPQYQFPRFTQPAVQQPVPFQLPSKNNNPDSYLYDDDNASRNSDQQVPRPHPFQPAPKPVQVKPQPHSHYLTSSHNHDPSQTETFLGQITLQSPDLPPDFNPDIPAFKPSKEFPFNRSPSLVDQFAPSNDKWRKPQNIPVGAARPNNRPRASNKPFRELSDAVDQHLEEYIEKENNHRNDLNYNRRKPTVLNLDRHYSNSVQSNNNISSQRSRVVPPTGREYKSRPQVNNFLINNNGDVYTTARSGFRPKPTTTTQATTTPERRNRFHPTTKSPAKPLAFHLKPNKVPFAPKRAHGTSTTENTFDLESLLEDPVKQNGGHSDHDDDVEVIQSATTVQTTTEEEILTTVTEENEKTTDFTHLHSHDYTTSAEYEQGTTGIESKEVDTTDYSGEDSSTTNVNTEGSKSTETESSVQDSTVQDSTVQDSTIQDSTVHDSTEQHSSAEDNTTNDSTTHDSTTNDNSSHETTVQSTSNDSQNTTVPASNDYYTTSHDSIEHDSTLSDSTVHSDDAHSEYYDDEYADVEEEKNSTDVPHLTTVHEDAKTTPLENDIMATSESDSKTSEEVLTFSTLADISNPTKNTFTTVSDTSFDVLTIKPTPKTVAHDNFNDFVDSTLIDNSTDEPEKFANTSSDERIVAGPETTVTTERYQATTIPPKDEPVLIGEAVVSVVTTKSVINGTFSIPTAAPQVTQQMKAPENLNDTSSESWMVVASVQTSRSVSGARYLAFPVIEEEKRAQLLNEQPYLDSDYTESGEEISENPIKHSGEVNSSTSTSSTESISDKLDRVQSELSSGFLAGGFRNSISNIAVITEPVPEKTTVSTTTTTTTTTTTQKPTTTPIPVIIRKFSANLRPTSTGRPHRRQHVFESIKQDDLTGLLPPGFKPKYVNYKTTTTTQLPSDLDLPQGDEPAKNSDQNGTVGRSSGISNKNKVTIQDDVSSLLPPGFKPPKESDLPNDPVKTLEEIFGKAVKSETARNNNRSRTNSKLLDNAKEAENIHLLPPGFKATKESSTTAKPKGPDVLSKAVPVDISAFLPPGYKPVTEKSKDASNILSKAQPVDISAFLPPGFKSQNEDKPKNVSAILAKAEPVDISALLPPGFKPKAEATTTEKPKGVNGLLADAVPVDISAFLPPGYKQKFTTRKPVTQETSTTSKATESTPTVASTTAGNFKVVFPSRPGGRKPINRITTPKPLEANGPGAVTPPQIIKWSTRYVCFYISTLVVI